VRRRFATAHTITDILRFVETHIYTLMVVDMGHHVSIAMAMGYPVQKFKCCSHDDIHVQAQRQEGSEREGSDRTLKELEIVHDSAVWVTISSLP
jgi:hypothetical protein